MTVLEQVYADAELVTVSFLNNRFPTARVAVELPADLQPNTIWVQRFTGTNGVPSISIPVLDVDCFAVDRLAANTFASQVQAAFLFGAIGYQSHNAIVADVSVSDFGWRPYANTNVRRVGMTVQLTLHNQ